MTSSWRPAASVGAMRRYTWWTFAFFAVVAAVVPAIFLWIVDLPLWRTAILAVLLAAVTGQHARLLRDAVNRPGEGVRAPWWAASGALAALTALVLVPPEATAPDAIVLWVLPAAGMVGALAVTARPRLRWPILITGLVLVEACTVFPTVADPGFGDPVLAGVNTVVLMVIVAGTYLTQVWVWQVTLRLDAARRTEAELAVAHERLRFAADLHDMQGHHLQVIALKGELVSRLIGIDDATARREADELAGLARTALADTREVVQGFRRASLSTEVGNAVGVLRAAGIDTDVHGNPDAVPAALQPLFSALVREGTTNVLRHSRARRATLEVGITNGAVRLAIRNDAASEAVATDGSGLAGLRERFAAVGGSVRAGRDGGSFELVGTA